jgi:hypothetical protein
MLPILGGCQTTSIGVKVLNRCGQAVEVRADSIAESTTTWQPIGADEGTEVVDIPDDTKLIYVQVRANENALPMLFIASVTGRPNPRPGADNDVEIVLDGDRCPRAALVGATSDRSQTPVGSVALSDRK